jgi:AbiV family abortive infection protein
MEKKRSFLEISPNECLDVYPEVQANAAQLFEGGKLLEVAGYYGQAISHLILGTEEYIKSLCLFLEGKGFQLRKIKDIKRIFNNHAARHSIIRDSYSVWMVFKHLYSLNRKSTGRQIFQKSLHAALTIFSAIRNYEWWAQADKLKNKGLYVDYTDGLLLPSSLTKKDYDLAFRFTSPIPKEIEEFIHHISRMSPSRLTDFRQLLKDVDFESLISESITRKT